MGRDEGVQLHKNGNYWQARWYDSNGRRKTRSLGKRKDAGGEVSERAARRKCSAIATELAIEPGKRDQERRPPTLAEWVDQFKIIRADLSPQSLRIYADAANLMIAHWGKGRKIETITHLDAAEFAAGVERQYSNIQTARKHLRHAKGIFARAKKLRLIAVNPFDGVTTVPPEADRDWEHVSAEQFAAILEQSPTEWRAMFGLFRFAGLRRGEAVRLAWSDVDFDKRLITVQNPGRVETTKAKRRIVPIQPKLYAILVERFNAADPGTTVTGLTMNNLDRAARAIIKRAGVEPWSDIFHTLRKNCESEWLAEYPVMDVCAWLGHNPKVAAKHYHQVQQHVVDQVTGVAAEREADELADAREQIARLRRRLRRVLRVARPRKDA